MPKKPIRQTQPSQTSGQEFGGAKLSDEQIGAFKAVWKALQGVKKAGDLLWKEVTWENITQFADRLKEAQDNVFGDAFFFSPDEYQQLKKLIDAFEMYQAEKEKLYELRTGNQKESEPMREWAVQEVSRQIQENKKQLDQYNSLLDSLHTRYYSRLFPNLSEERLSSSSASDPANAGIRKPLPAKGNHDRLKSLLVGGSFKKWAIASTIFVIIVLAAHIMRLPKSDDAPKGAARNNSWEYLNPRSDTCIIFVHGVLSDSTGCWTNVSSRTFWPRLVAEDSTFSTAVNAGTNGSIEHISVFLGGYYTAIDAGDYGVEDCAKELFAGLTRESQGASALSFSNLLFVCHSTGGLVVRQMLVNNTGVFAAKRIGLVLVASPALGSQWGTKFEALAKEFNNRLAGELAWMSSSVKALDSQFKGVQKRLPFLVGQEWVENHFIVHFKFWPSKSFVVPYEATGRYFENLTIPETDHFTIVKPQNSNAKPHLFLKDFFQNSFRPELHIPATLKDLRPLTNDLSRELLINPRAFIDFSVTNVTLHGIKIGDLATDIPKNAITGKLNNAVLYSHKNVFYVYGKTVSGFVLNGNLIADAFSIVSEEDIRRVFGQHDLIGGLPRRPIYFYCQKGFYLSWDEDQKRLVSLTLEYPSIRPGQVELTRNPLALLSTHGLDLAVRGVKILDDASSIPPADRIQTNGQTFVCKDGINYKISEGIVRSISISNAQIIAAANLNSVDAVFDRFSVVSISSNSSTAIWRDKNLCITFVENPETRSISEVSWDLNR